MFIADFLNFALDDSLEEARLASCADPGHLGLRGVEKAVEECRGCMTGDDMVRNLSCLLGSARADSAAAIALERPDQWFWFSREAHVEWIADIVSVVLFERRLPTIVPPTRGAAIAAAALIGVLPFPDA